MRAPGDWLELDEVSSTQTVAAELLRAGDPVGVVFAHHQIQGRGRFDRVWESRRGESLTMSLVMSAYVDHSAPWLVGMSVAIACACALNCKLRWPNDLSLGGKKVGGILTEILPDSNGRRVPVVGVGLNLSQTSFPEELGQTATSLALEGFEPGDAAALAQTIVGGLLKLPEPHTWASIEELWADRDDTPGKWYRLPDGSVGLAVRVTRDGALECKVGEETQLILAADAIFG